MPGVKARKIGRPVYLRFRVTGIERNVDDDGGLVTCTKVTSSGKVHRIRKNEKSHICLYMDTNLPDIGDLVTVVFNWKGETSYGRKAKSAKTKQKSN